MNLIKCDVCQKYFEDEDVQKVEHQFLCYKCVKQCKHCNRPFLYPSETEYCYWCLEGNLVEP